jgi:riboflavin synthase
MFTGIVENTARLLETHKNGSNISFVFESDLAKELKVDQSLSHNGVCLTVEKIWLDKNTYQVTAIDETLQKTNLGYLQLSDLVNLERCMKADGRFDGHIVQGHVDQIGKCMDIVDQQGSWKIFVEYDPQNGNITVEKGSICLNGISLTVVDSEEGKFSVAIIPYTWQNTNLNQLKVGDMLNLEFDILGKYITKMLNKRL